MRTKVAMLLVVLSVGYVLSAQTQGIQINTNKADAEVYLDGAFQGVTENKFDMIFYYSDLKPGSYTITLKLEGFPDYIKNIKVVSGKIEIIEHTFEKAQITSKAIVDQSSGKVEKSQ
jgi:hypothetical protein